MRGKGTGSEDMYSPAQPQETSSHVCAPLLNTISEGGRLGLVLRLRVLQLPMTAPCCQLLVPSLHLSGEGLP